MYTKWDGTYNFVYRILMTKPFWDKECLSNPWLLYEVDTNKELVELYEKFNDETHNGDEVINTIMTIVNFYELEGAEPSEEQLAIVTETVYSKMLNIRDIYYEIEQKILALDSRIKFRISAYEKMCNVINDVDKATNYKYAKKDAVLD